MGSIYDDIIKKHDECIFSAFNYYGYSREWLLDPVNRDRVTCVETSLITGDSVQAWLVDGERLFDIITEPAMNVEETKIGQTTYSVTSKVYVRLIKDKELGERLTEHSEVE